MIATILVATHYSTGSYVYLSKAKKHTPRWREKAWVRSAEGAANSQTTIAVPHNSHFRLLFCQAVSFSFLC